MKKHDDFDMQKWEPVLMRQIQLTMSSLQGMVIITNVSITLSENLKVCEVLFACMHSLIRNNYHKVNLFF